MSRRRWAVVAVVLLILAGAVAYAMDPTHSQLALFPPPGARPPPVPVEGVPSGQRGPAVLAFAGDAMLGRRVARRLERNPRLDLWARLAPALEGVDLFASNLECSITERGARWPDKLYAFRSKPGLAARSLGGIPVPDGAGRFASLANNHALDFGPEGLEDTVTILDELGWLHAGAGANAIEAHRPAVHTTASGLRVGLLSASDHCSCDSPSDWMAGAEQPGLWHVDMSFGRWGHLLEAVAALDAQVDLVVLSMHWGPNYLDEDPPRWMRRLARALVEAGADVVVGHSAHHVLPVEVIDGKHVFYGLGDLMHDYAVREQYDSDLGMVARVSVDAEGGQTLELVPLRIEGTKLRLIEPDDPDHAAVLRRANWPPGLGR